MPETPVPSVRDTPTGLFIKYCIVACQGIQPHLPYIEYSKLQNTVQRRQK